MLWYTFTYFTILVARPEDKQKRKNLFLWQPSCEHESGFSLGIFFPSCRLWRINRYRSDRFSHDSIWEVHLPKHKLGCLSLIVSAHLKLFIHLIMSVLPHCYIGVGDKFQHEWQMRSAACLSVRMLLVDSSRLKHAAEQTKEPLNSSCCLVSRREDLLESWKKMSLPL